MSSVKGFYVRLWCKDTSSGVYKCASNASGVSLEDNKTFGFCRYKSCDGLEATGKVKSLYVEEYAESDDVRVWQSAVLSRSSGSVTLVLYWFGVDPSLGYSGILDESEELRQVSVASSGYNSFRSALDGCLVEYWDDYRCRRVLLYLEEAVSMSVDKLCVLPYKEVSFKFGNVFGGSFPLDDDTISTWLSSGGRLPASSPSSG